jgi:hypothetical protein
LPEIGLDLGKDECPKDFQIITFFELLAETRGAF